MFSGVKTLPQRPFYCSLLEVSRIESICTTDQIRKLSSQRCVTGNYDRSREELGYLPRKTVFTTGTLLTYLQYFYKITEKVAENEDIHMSCHSN